MRILITGADGFVGRHLSSALCSAGYELTLSVRKDVGQLRVEGDNRLVQVGNVDGHTDWSQALRDVDCVINLAGRAHILQENAANAKQVFMDVNCAGASRLHQASKEAGVKEFIHLSSAHVLGTQTFSSAPFSDDSQPNPTNDYARSKWEGEQALRRQATAHSSSLIILRPPLIVGKGAKGNLEKLQNWLKKPIPLPFSGLENRRSLLSVENLTSAILAILGYWEKLPRSGTYLIADADVVSTSDIFRGISAGAGGRARLMHLSKPILAFLLKMVGGEKLVAQLMGDLEIDSRRFQTEFSWTAQTKTFESLSRMAGGSGPKN